MEGLIKKLLLLSIVLFLLYSFDFKEETKPLVKSKEDRSLTLDGNIQKVIDSSMDLGRYRACAEFFADNGDFFLSEKSRTEYNKLLSNDFNSDIYYQSLESTKRILDEYPNFCLELFPSKSD